MALALPSDLEISCDPSRIDVSLVHEFLRTSYWAEGRSRETVERSIRHSLCFGVYTADRQIAFARVITDRAVFAYLADVFVVPDFRQRGVSKALLRAILAPSGSSEPSNVFLGDSRCSWPLCTIWV
jgi:N-acetylglutamate synthase-like GNAT family acetyltransferase